MKKEKSDRVVTELISTVDEEVGVSLSRNPFLGVRRSPCHCLGGVFLNEGDFTLHLSRAGGSSFEANFKSDLTSVRHVLKAGS
jgi:hypothetical protein